MRRLLPFLLCATAFAQGPTLPFGFVPQASGGGSAPTVVGAGSGGTGFSSTLTFNIQKPQGTNVSVPSGTKIVLLAACATSATSSFTVTDNCNTGGTSDTFSTLDAYQQNGTSAGGQTFTATTGATTSVCTMTVVCAATGGAAAGAAVAYSGSTGIDIHNLSYQSFPGTGTNAVASTQGTTTDANDLCVTLTADPSGSAETITAGTSSVAWTGLSLSPTTDGGTGVEYFDKATTGTITGTFTTSYAFSLPFTPLVCAHP
jgi:hypothetical protein